MNAAKVNAEILLLALAIVIEAKGLRDAIKVMSKRFRVPSCIDVALDRVCRLVNLGCIDAALIATERSVFKYLEGFKDSHTRLHALKYIQVSNPE